MQPTKKLFDIFHDLARKLFNTLSRVLYDAKATMNYHKINISFLLALLDRGENFKRTP